MEKIVVTTDLSANSRAGMRYAIQLARQRNAELIFLHVHFVLRASMWSDELYAHYVKEMQEAIMDELPGFVKSVYHTMKVPAEGYRLELVNKIDTVDSIISFAQSVQADYIIISTRGAGKLKKLYGTNTSSLISKSPLPVICVPSTFRVKPIGKLLYASDMTDYEQELKQVVSFARPINATIEMLHVAYPFELILDKQLAEQSLKNKVGYDVNLHYTGHSNDAPLMELIEAAVKSSKTDLLVMFTNQERSFFERVFLSSSAQTYSFNAKVPLLSFRKTAGILQA